MLQQIRRAFCGNVARRLESAFIMRRAADRRWSPEAIQSVVGSPEEPVPVSGERRILAYAHRAPEEVPKQHGYVPMTEPAEAVRAAKIHQRDVEGASDRCPGCKAANNCKYSASHTFECRQSFERIL